MTMYPACRASPTVNSAIFQFANVEPGARKVARLVLSETAVESSSVFKAEGLTVLLGTGCL